MDNERKRTGTLVNYDLLAGLGLTAQGNPVTAAQPIPYGVDHLIGFNELLTCGGTDGAGVHFYIDDYQFERFWRSPERYLRALLAFPAPALEPLPQSDADGLDAAAGSGLRPERQLDRFRELRLVF